MFKKIGDAVNIDAFFDKDLNKEVCKKCGKKLNTLLIDDDLNLICECEDMEIDDDKNSD